MPDVVEIHAVCRNREGVTNENIDSFESGEWEISPQHLRLGVTFALHQSKPKSSYLQGTILKAERLSSGRHKIFLKRTAASLAWRGGGSGEIGFLYSGADWRRLPQVPVVVQLRAGGNHALKNLNESNPAAFSYPFAGAFAAEGKANSDRQAMFHTYLLRIALALRNNTIPYAFRDASETPLRLDDGAIAIAIRQRVLNEPVAEADGRVHIVTVTDRYWNEANVTGLLETLRELNNAQNPTAGDIFGQFDPAMISPESIRKALVEVREARKGQADFRKALIEAYNGRCAVSGCEIESALEAAHIIPDHLVGENGMDPRNGILLRADIHRLFDAGLIGFRFEGDNLQIVLSADLNTTTYSEYSARFLNLPTSTSLRPSERCIARRWEALPVDKESQ